jgi:hypothetical protein
MMPVKHSALIQDGQSFNGAKYESGYQIATYDDGFGPLWISRNSLGINGIVRAQSWEDAYEICEDEFFPEADETIDELKTEYGFKREHVRETDAAGQFIGWKLVETPDPESWPENECFQEGFGFRPNGPNETDVLKHGIYSKDLNGDYLDPLTPELVKELGIVLDITTDEER